MKIEKLLCHKKTILQTMYWRWAVMLDIEHQHEIFSYPDVAIWTADSACLHETQESTAVHLQQIYHFYACNIKLHSAVCIAVTYLEYCNNWYTSFKGFPS
jgi:hypothetical protein